VKSSTNDFIRSLFLKYSISPGRTWPRKLRYRSSLEDVLFICDYVFLKGERASLNPFGPPVQTKEGFNKIMAVIKDRDITTVCGYQDVTDFVSWKQRADLIP
jgi:hypothetical protein